MFNLVSNFQNIVTGGTDLATGGSVADIDGYRIHTFTSSGTFSILADRLNNVEYLVVAGGGGGGNSSANGSGGGGAGGVYETISPIFMNTGDYAVVVGEGGLGAITDGSTGDGYGEDGGTSSFNGINCLGGGSGGGIDTPNTPVDLEGRDGGCGGGGSGRGSELGGEGIGNYFSNDGGQGNGAVSNDRAGGGGGGSTSVGQDATQGNGGDGGSGYTTAISGTTASYAGGGGGGVRTASGNTAGLGQDGGGAGFAGLGDGGDATTAGSGGGGAGGTSETNRAGNGADGIVIIRYPIVDASTDVPNLADYEFYYDSAFGTEFTDLSGNANDGTITTNGSGGGSSVTHLIDHWDFAATTPTSEDKYIDTGVAVGDISSASFSIVSIFRTDDFDSNFTVFDNLSSVNANFFLVGVSRTSQAIFANIRPTASDSGNWRSIITSSNSITANTWHLMVLTHDGTNFNIYLDDMTSSAASAASTSPFTSTDNFIIGNDLLSSTQANDGDIAVTGFARGIAFDTTERAAIKTYYQSLYSL